MWRVISLMKPAFIWLGFRWPDCHVIAEQYGGPDDKPSWAGSGPRTRVNPWGPELRSANMYNVFDQQYVSSGSGDQWGVPGLAGICRLHWCDCIERPETVQSYKSTVNAQADRYFKREPGRPYLLLQPFPYLGSVHRVFNLHVLLSGASSIFTCFAFLSFLISSLHLSFSLPIVRCPPTDFLLTFSHYYIFLCLSVHMSWPYQSSFYYFSHMFATSAFALDYFVLIFSILFIPTTHLNILISVLSSS